MSVKQLLTADDLLTMPDVPGKRFELVNGELVEMTATSLLHNALVGLVFVLLRTFVRERGLGMVCVDGAAYILRRDPDLVRVPDVSFVARDRIPVGGLGLVFWPFAPDLAVEIVSPNDRPGEVRTKVGEYVAAGARAVWVMSPARQALTVHRPNSASVTLGPDDEVDGGDVLPGFRVRVRDLFDIDA